MWERLIICWSTLAIFPRARWAGSSPQSQRRKKLSFRWSLAANLWWTTFRMICSFGRKNAFWIALRLLGGKNACICCDVSFMCMSLHLRACTLGFKARVHSVRMHVIFLNVNGYVRWFGWRSVIMTRCLPATSPAETPDEPCRVPVPCARCSNPWSQLPKTFIPTPARSSCIFSHSGNISRYSEALERIVLFVPFVVLALDSFTVIGTRI